MEYDAKYNRILVSNKGNADNNNKGFILQMNPDGTNLREFSNEQKDPFNALEIVADTVFAACEDGNVYGYRLSNGQQVIKWELQGAQTPNGLTHNGNILYVSDAAKNNVYRIDINSGYDSLWVVGGDAININGIYMDNANQRLFLCGWENKDKYVDVYAVDLTTGKVTEYYDGSSSKVDGMARDKCGNYYLSFWSENKVFKYSSCNFDNPILIKDATDGLDGPADIGIDTVNNNLLIPNLNNSTVTILNLEQYCPSVNVIDMHVNSNDFIFPNPSNGTFYWNSALPINRIEVFSLSGQLLMTQKKRSEHNAMHFSAMNNQMVIVCAVLENNTILTQKIIINP